MYAKKAFSGIIGGKEVTFAEGDEIPNTIAKELGLSAKPDLAQKSKPKEDAPDVEAAKS